MSVEAAPQILDDAQFQPKAPLLHDVYYSIAELSNRQSPYRVASQATIFRAMRDGKLVPNRIGRKTLIKGSKIHKWLEGDEEQ